MISEYGGKEKYANKKEEQKHEAKETAKKEASEKPDKKKIVLGKKKEEPRNEEGNTAKTERVYMQEVRDQMKREKEDKEKFDNTPVGLMSRGKAAENRGDKKEAGRLYEAAKRAGLNLKNK
jgi:hypothetical protein